ncbi:UNVERIFIED_CONTAM: hypothetical protein HDU68_004472 [Siphonaria sp. JEL0065]|nr:hypothetical protein HDU68_004472 [Siphonaria sp. JEL0065]
MGYLTSFDSSDPERRKQCLCSYNSNGPYTFVHRKEDLIMQVAHVKGFMIPGDGGMESVPKTLRFFNSPKNIGVPQPKPSLKEWAACFEKQEKEKHAWRIAYLETQDAILEKNKDVLKAAKGEYQVYYDELLIDGAEMTAQETFVLQAANFAVASIPNATASVDGSYAGLLPSGPNSNYFFWYFPVAANTTSDNLVVFLNGGPGCSSMAGALMENGPFSIQEDGSLIDNPFSWNTKANVLYVDQPVGAGFSLESIKTPTFNETNVAASFYTFMDNFLAVFPETQKHSLYLTGESYAGMYIPYITKHFLEVETWSNGIPIMLAGIAFGNPLLDPSAQQSPSAAVNDFDFFEQSGFFAKPNATGIRQQAASLAQECKNATLEQAFDLPGSCSMIQFLETWYQQSSSNNNTCFDPYNIDYDITCDNHFFNRYWKHEEALTAYFNDPTVQSAIHMSQQLNAYPLFGKFSWSVCNSMIHIDDSLVAASSSLFDSIVAVGVKVLVYTGVRDSVVNYVSTARVLGNTTWAGKVGFGDVAATDWIVDSDIVGKVWKDRGLTYIEVNGAGHMVPADAPASALAVLGALLGMGTGHVESILETSVSSSPVLKPFNLYSSDSKKVAMFSFLFVWLSQLVV